MVQSNLAFCICACVTSVLMPVCIVSAGLRQSHMMGCICVVCVCLEVPLAPMVSLCIASSLTCCPPSFTSLCLPFLRANSSATYLWLLKCQRAWTELPFESPRGLLYSLRLRLRFRTEVVLVNLIFRVWA